MATLVIANSYTSNSGDNTSFRAYGTAISNAFANSGWTKVNDAGVVNWSTVVANGTANATQVNAFEIWKMGDQYANSTPVYVRLEYRTITTVNSPGFVLQIGNGTDGSGNMQGLPTAPLTVRSSVSNVQVPYYFCGSNNRITMALTTATTQSVFINIERTHDANGNDTEEGVIFQLAGYITSSGSVYYYQQFWSATTGPATAETNIGSFLPVGGSSSGNGNVANLYPIYPASGMFVNPFLNAIYCPTTYCSAGYPFTVPSFYGASRRYLPFNSQGWTNRSSGTAANYLICMRWE